jgi:tripeptide aminopeptidase
MLPPETLEFIRRDVLERFMRYVQISTGSDPLSDDKPTTARQHDLLSLLANELRALGLNNVTHTANGFLYATLTGSSAYEPFGLMAHVDTSPDQSGEGVMPILREQYDGGVLRFPNDAELTLSPEDSAQLRDFIGDTIITASGRTLLGADDKAGVAEIMTALATFRAFPTLLHGTIEVCFTTDEEVGHGVDGIDTSRLPRHVYTMDGGYPGELQTECFDAYRATIKIQGRGVHPGYAYGKMINAALVATRFIESLPAQERPETTRDREGFFHVSEVRANNERAEIEIIVRDFENSNNLKRLERLHELRSKLELEHPGATIELAITHQYENMREILAQHPEIVERAVRAIEDAGLRVRRHPIRGGTDGSRLTAMGYPSPNIFAGGMMFHSRREWIALSALSGAVQTIVHLARHHQRSSR